MDLAYDSKDSVTICVLHGANPIHSCLNNSSLIIKNTSSLH